MILPEVFGKMRITYDRDIDYMEIFFKKEANYADEMSEHVMVFKSEKTDKPVGYAFGNCPSIS